MNRARGWNRFEFLVVVSVIGIILLVATTHYLQLAREGRRLSFELLAHNFTTAIAMTRVQWIVKPERQNFDNSRVLNYVDINGQFIYVNNAGWPVATKPLSTNAVTVNNCQELWQSMLQNPAPATLEGQTKWGKDRYHISAPDKNVCRYELVTKERGKYFFEYSTGTGQISVHVPANETVSSL